MVAKIAKPAGQPVLPAPSKGGAGGAKPAIADPVANWRDNITSHVGPRQSPGGIGSTDHKGIDVGVPTGTPVQSVKKGEVVFAGDAGGYGNLVVVKHDDGTYTKYAHLHEINAQAGQTVEAGQVIGKVGNTGNSTGPHLHFEVRKGGENGTVLDPMAYLAGSESVAAVDPGPGASYAGTGGGGGSTLSLSGGGGTPSQLSLGGGGGLA
jgi:murein DD-endopeptidase MepM/ murein hydrolase activator NlpD